MAVTFLAINIEENRPATIEEIENELFLNCWVDGSGTFELNEKMSNGIATDTGRKFRVEIIDAK